MGAAMALSLLGARGSAFVGSKTSTLLPAASRVAGGVRPSSSLTPLQSGDHSYDYPAVPVGDPSKRAFNYAVLGGARLIYASATRLIAMKFIASMSASADVLAMANTEVNLENIEEGQGVTVKWRGKPVFVRNRSEAEIAGARKVPMSALRDPQTDEERVKDDTGRWLVTVGVCTHLGCVPLAGAVTTMGTSALVTALTTTHLGVFAKAQHPSTLTSLHMS